MATEADITSLRHDIRNLNQTLTLFGAQLASATADLKGLQSWVASIDKAVDGVQIDNAKRKGGWTTLGALLAAAGTLGGLLSQLIPLHR